MALEGGADHVLELPVHFATAAAPIFASAGRKKGYHNKQGEQYRREAGSRHQE